MWGKVEPRYIVSLVVLEQFNDQAFSLELPAGLERIQDVFHVFYFLMFLVQEPSILPLDELLVDESKHLVEEP